MGYSVQREYCGKASKTEHNRLESTKASANTAQEDLNQGSQYEQERRARICSTRKSTIKNITKPLVLKKTFHNWVEVLNQFQENRHFYLSYLFSLCFTATFVFYGNEFT